MEITKLNKTIQEFIETFEEIFDKDWSYSKEMLNISDETEEQKIAAEEMGLETIVIISKKGTFLNPDVNDETEDWGARGKLLNKYRELKELLEEKI